MVQQVHCYALGAHAECGQTFTPCVHERNVSEDLCRTYPWPVDGTDRFGEIILKADCSSISNFINELETLFNQRGLAIIVSVNLSAVKSSEWLV